MSWLGDLIADAVDDVTSTVDLTVMAIDVAVHQAAVGLLNAALPPMVHSGYALVKTGNEVLINGAAGAVTFTLGSANVSAALSGTVEKKVTEGLTHLKADTDYARAARSITS